MLSAPLYSDIFVYVGKNLCYDTRVTSQKSTQACLQEELLRGQEPVPHEQVAIFKENERIVNVVQIERVRSTERSGRYHNNPEKKKEK